MSLFLCIFDGVDELQEVILHICVATVADWRMALGLMVVIVKGEW